MLFKRRVARAQLLALAVSYAGVLLVFGHELQLDSGTRLRAALVFASTLSYAVTWSTAARGQRLARRLTGRPPAWPACCILQFLLLRRGTARWRCAAGAGCRLNATLCTFAPVLLVMMAIERVGAAVASQAGMIGPLSTIAMGVWILGEALNGWIVAGTLLVLGGITMLARQR